MHLALLFFRRHLEIDAVRGCHNDLFWSKGLLTLHNGRFFPERLLFFRSFLCLGLHLLLLLSNSFRNVVNIDLRSFRCVFDRLHGFLLSILDVLVSLLDEL